MTALGSDHAGYELRHVLKEYLQSAGEKCEDFGGFKTESNDYPVFARSVCEAVLSGKCGWGVLICTTGIGMTMAANRFRGIRAALCHDAFTAAAARLHNNANVLVMGSKIVSAELAVEIVKTFYATDFSDIDRHKRRIGMLDE